MAIIVTKNVWKLTRSQFDELMVIVQEPSSDLITTF